ncbi:hypothetical protein ACT7DG_08940 [Bacillus cereus]
MGMMIGANSEGLSLGGAISNFFISISNESTFPLFTFFKCLVSLIFSFHLVAVNGLCKHQL